MELIFWRCQFMDSDPQKPGIAVCPALALYKMVCDLTINVGQIT
jgi:hypothetical protein